MVDIEHLGVGLGDEAFQSESLEEDLRRNSELRSARISSTVMVSGWNAIL